MSKLLLPFIFLSISTALVGSAKTDAQDKNAVNGPPDPSPSKFKVSGIKAASHNKLLSIDGEITIDGFFLTCPEKKTKSPVHFKVGVEIDQKQRPDIILRDGEYFVQTIREDLSIPTERLTVGKGRTFTYLEEGRSEIDLELSPGKYSATTGFRSKSQTASGGWVSDTCLFEILSP